MTKAIVTDLDNTLVDVTERFFVSLVESGLFKDEYLNWEKNELPQYLWKNWSEQDQKTFFRYFLDDRKLVLDSPKNDVIRKVEELGQREKMPIVILTSRPSYMRKTLEQVCDLGLRWNLLLMRHSDCDMPSCVFKRIALRRNDIFPVYFIDDELSNCSYVQEAYPSSIVLHPDEL